MTKSRWRIVAGALLTVVALVAGFLTTDRRGPNVTPAPVIRRLAQHVTQQAPAIISGTVTDEHRAPIPGARVCATLTGKHTAQTLSRVPVCTQTDAHGTYDLTVSAGSYEVVASARMFQPARFNDKDGVAAEISQHRTGIDIELLAGAVQIDGTVSDIGGGPIASATVHAESPTAAHSSVEVDAAGHFTMWVAPGMQFLHAEADGYANEYRRCVAPGATSYNFALVPGASIEGTVVDAASGQPIAGIAVDSVRTMGYGHDGAPETVTDEAGHFVIDRLLPDLYGVRADGPDIAGRAEGLFPVGVGQQITGVVVKAFPVQRISGRVVIAGTRDVCTGAFLLLSQLGWSETLDHGRAADGSVYADGAAPGTYSVEVGCNSGVPRDKYPAVEVLDKPLSGLTWEVDPGATIRGRVRTSSGQPVIGAQIFTLGHSSEPTDQDGRYILPGIPVGSHRLFIRDRDASNPIGGWQLEVSALATIDKDLVVENDAVIKGIVTDREGRPIAGAIISAAHDPLVESEIQLGRTEDSHADGTFALHVASGRYNVEVVYSTVRSSQSVNTRAAADIKLVLEVPKADRTITGYVLGSDGSPIPDAYVRVTRRDGPVFDQPSVALSGTDGAFTIKKVIAGTYAVTATTKSGGEASNEVEAGHTTKITIATAATMEGTVRVGAVLPEDFYVDMVGIGQSTARREHFVRTHGHYTVRGLPPGHYHMAFIALRHHRDVTTEIASAEHRILDVDFEGGVSVRGRVVDAFTKQPLANITVGIQMPDSPYELAGTEPVVLTDATGHFQIEHVPAGTTYITANGRAEQGYDFVGNIAVVGTRDVDLGDLPTAKRRVASASDAGELGVQWEALPADLPSDKRSFVVAQIEPGSAAASSGLRVGDSVITVDGLSCLGNNRSSAWTLLTVPPGTSVELGLQRGVVVTVVAGPARW